MLPLLLAVATAVAEPRPVVIRLDSQGAALASPLVVRLTGGGVATEVVLADDGERPDFAKGDGRFAGVSQVDATELKLELLAGGTSLGSGSATFEDPTAPHDVDLSVTDGVLNVAVSSPPSPGAADGGASVGGGAGGQPNPGGAPVAGVGGPGGAGPGDGAGGTPPAGGAAPTGAAPRAPVTFPDGGSSDGLLFIGFGVGLLALLGVAWLWRRNRSGGGKARTAELQVVPEPGLFSPRFPSLSDGLSAWVAEGQAAALVNPLITHLAERHRVLVVARAEVEVRPVAGGPVYRIVGVRPGLVGDVAEALAEEGGAPLVVLIVLDAGDREALRDYRDLLPREVGGIVLLEKAMDSALPQIDVSEAPGGWALRHGETTVTVVAGARGLEVVGAS